MVHPTYFSSHILLLEKTSSTPTQARNSANSELGVLDFVWYTNNVKIPSLIEMQSLEQIWWMVRQCQVRRAPWCLVGIAY